MTNTDSAFGFRLADSSVGNPMGGFIEYTVDAANATAIFKNDPISREADGNVKASAAGDGFLVESVAQVLLDENDKEVSFLPALAAGKVIGVPVKGRIFMVQCDGAFAKTDEGATADFVPGAGDQGSGFGRYELDSSNIGTGNQLRILNLAKETRDNDFGDNANVMVAFVENSLEDSTTI